jgi:hypothetical protein
MNNFNKVQDMFERNLTIYKMRVEEKKTLRVVADRFGICTERVRQIIAKQGRIFAAEIRRRAAAPDTVGAMHLSLRMKNCLLNEYAHPWDKLEAIPVITLLKDLPLVEMRKIPNMGKKTVKDFVDEAKTIVGADTMQRWLNGEQP